MIALDTNVLVRYLVQDLESQSEIAGRLIDSLTFDNPGFVSREVAVELVRVLERAYGFGRNDIADVLGGLLAAAEIRLEAALDIALAVERMRERGAGFADGMIWSASRNAGCRSLATFDRGMASLPGVDVLAE
jgi:predicted nucleic-acid-binding protein